MKPWLTRTKNKSKSAELRSKLANKRISCQLIRLLWRLKTAKNNKVTTFQVLYFMVI